MKEILLLSGKGGTGKTTITGALAALMTNKVMAESIVLGVPLLSHKPASPAAGAVRELWHSLRKI